MPNGSISEKRTSAGAPIAARNTRLWITARALSLEALSVRTIVGPLAASSGTVFGMTMPCSPSRVRSLTCAIQMFQGVSGFGLRAISFQASLDQGAIATGKRCSSLATSAANSGVTWFKARTAENSSASARAAAWAAIVASCTWRARICPRRLLSLASISARRASRCCSAAVSRFRSAAESSSAISLALPGVALDAGLFQSFLHAQRPPKNRTALTHHASSIGVSRLWSLAGETGWVKASGSAYWSFWRRLPLPFPVVEGLVEVLFIGSVRPASAALLDRSSCRRSNCRWTVFGSAFPCAICAWIAVTAFCRSPRRIRPARPAFRAADSFEQKASAGNSSKVSQRTETARCFMDRSQYFRQHVCESITQK